MDDNRRATRHLHSTDGVSPISAVDSLRTSTADSGRGSMTVSERTTTLESRANSGTASALSRDTPIDGSENIVPLEPHEEKPVRIPRTSVLAPRCYEQAYVSYVDHPSAFFLQLAHFEKQYKELEEEINKYYSKTPLSNPLVEWKRGDYCIAKYKDIYYRARIIEVPQVTKTPGLYDVVYVDYGNWSKVPSADIHPLLPKFAILTAQAIPCSLTKALPRSGTWFDHPMAIKLFEQLVLDKYVDATFQLPSSRDFWPLTFVDLSLSSTKQNVREVMKDRNLIREVPNDRIYPEFNHLLKPVDYIIYNIRHEDEENDDD